MILDTYMSWDEKLNTHENFDNWFEVYQETVHEHFPVEMSVRDLMKLAFCAGANLMHSVYAQGKMKGFND